MPALPLYSKIFVIVVVVAAAAAATAVISSLTSLLTQQFSKCQHLSHVSPFIPITERMNTEKARTTVAAMLTTTTMMTMTMMQASNDSQP